MSCHQTEILSYNVKVTKGSRHFWHVAKFIYFVLITADKNYVHEETQSSSVWGMIEIHFRVYYFPSPVRKCNNLKYAEL